MPQDQAVIKSALPCAAPLDGKYNKAIYDPFRDGGVRRHTEQPE